MCPGGGGGGGETIFATAWGKKVLEIRGLLLMLLVRLRVQTGGRKGWAFLSDSFSHLSQVGGDVIC